MYIEAWSEITLDSTFKRLCNSYTMACPLEHVLPSRESARMPAEVYMLTQVKHDLVYRPACLGNSYSFGQQDPGQKPAKVYRFSQRNMIAPASPPICPPSRRRDPGRTPAKVYPIPGRNIILKQPGTLTGSTRLIPDLQGCPRCRHACLI